MLGDFDSIFSNSGGKVREDELNGDVKIFGDSHHDVSAIHPKNVVEKQRPQENESDLERADIDGLEGGNGEEDTEYVVEEPVFCKVEKNDWNTADCSCDDGGE